MMWGKFSSTTQKEVIVKVQTFRKIIAKKPWPKRGPQRWIEKLGRLLGQIASQETVAQRGPQRWIEKLGRHLGKLNAKKQ